MKESTRISLVEKLNTEPELPTMYFTCSMTFVGVGLFFATYGRSIEIRLATLAFALFVLLCLTFYFAYRAYKNKKKLYIEFTEMEKRANTQSADRERAENELHRIQTESLERNAADLLYLIENYYRKEEKK